MTTLTEIRANALRSLIPPPRLRLSQWIEREIVLPEGVSALPGAVRLWPYQREITDTITDPACKRVTLLKPTRVAEGPAPAPRRPAAWPWPPQGWPLVRFAGCSTATRRADIRPFLGQPLHPKTPLL